MRRYIVIALLALLLAACEPSDKSEISITDPFLGGNTGLNIAFESFRTEVFDQGTDPFDVIVKLENKGEALVRKEDVRVKLSGINPVEFSKSSDQLSSMAPDDVIETRKDPVGTVLPGPLVFVEFTGLNHKSAIAGAQAKFPLRADVCYVYRTKAVSRLCVRENLLTPKADGICEINEAKTVFNSGSPVHVTNFRESSRARDKVGFSFEISNIGSGDIFQRNSVCDKSQRKNENRVYVLVSSSITGLKCTGLESTITGAEGFVTLYGGTKIVPCTQSIADRGDYEQLINVELIYDYEERIQNSLSVKTAGEQ